MKLERKSMYGGAAALILMASSGGMLFASGGKDNSQTETPIPQYTKDQIEEGIVADVQITQNKVLEPGRAVNITPPNFPGSSCECTVAPHQNQ